MHSNTIICYYYLSCTRAFFLPRFSQCNNDYPEFLLTISRVAWLRNALEDTLKSKEKRKRRRTKWKKESLKDTKSKQKEWNSFFFSFFDRIYSRHTAANATDGYARTHIHSGIKREYCPFCDRMSVCVCVGLSAESTRCVLCSVHLKEKKKSKRIRISTSNHRDWITYRPFAVVVIVVVVVRRQWLRAREN